jgi:outer membrane protein
MDTPQFRVRSGLKISFFNNFLTLSPVLFSMLTPLGSIAVAQETPKNPKEDSISHSSSAITLDLEKAMQLAQERALNVQMSNAISEETDARLSQSRGGLSPRLSLEANQIWNSKSVNKSVGTPSAALARIPAEIRNASFTIAQPLIALAPLYLKIQADSIASANASEFKKQTQKEARFSGAEAFVRVQKAELLLSIAKSSLAVVERQKADGDSLLRAGKINKVDVLKFDLALSDAKVQVAQAETTKEIALLGLVETLRLGDAKVTITAHADSLWERKKITVPQLSDALQSAYTNRPDLKAADGKIEVTNYILLATRLDYLPSLNAFAKYDHNFLAKDIPNVDPQTARAAPISFKKAEVQNNLSYGFNLKWDIWDGNQKWNKISETGAQFQKARIEREAAESKIKIETTQALLELKFAINSLEASKASVKLSEEAYRLTNARFKGGAATSTDLIGAERDQTRAQGGLANARGDLDISWFKLQKVMGKEPSTNEK